MAPPASAGRRCCTLILSTGCGAVLGAFVSMITSFALVEISISPMFSVYFGGLFILVGCLILWRVMSHESSQELPMSTRHLALFAGMIIVSGFLCFVLDKRFFMGLKLWMKVPLYTVLGSSVCFAMTFAIVDVLNYAIGFFQTAVAKPIVESVHQVGLVLVVSVMMGFVFGFTFGVLDVADEEVYHLRVALLRDEKITQPVGIALGAFAGAGLEYCRQRDDYSLIAAGKTEFDEDI